mmetsp:Transcript_40993/g.87315  ORF Transcript_40993/g.87315 Transcript_40993/m.87315 type:complete len:654 (-) Transcript_40993:36-1997(-)
MRWLSTLLLSLFAADYGGAADVPNATVQHGTAAGVLHPLDSCLIGDRGELRFELNATADSLCCAVAQIYLARRQGGYCPAIATLDPLPFGVRCVIDTGLGDAYVPDVATAQAAGHALCGLESCMAGIREALAVHGAAGVSAAGAPLCESVNESGAEAVAPPYQHAVLAGVAALSVAAAVAILHCVVTPCWIRMRVGAPLRVPAAIDAKQEKGGLRTVFTSAFSGGGGALRFHDISEDLEQSPSNGDPPPPQPQIVGKQGIGTGECLEGPDLEAFAVASFQDAQARCRAHLALLCGVGLATTLARLALATAASGGPPNFDLPSLAVLALCAWQLGVLVRVPWAPPPSPKNSDSVISLVGDLRAFAFTTVICELLALCASAGLLGSSTSSSDGSQSGDPAEANLDSFGHFLLVQASMSLTLLRLYTAWLANGLHRLRSELALSVLPQSEAPTASFREARELEVHAENEDGQPEEVPEAIIKMPKAMDMLATAWESEDGPRPGEDPRRQAERVARRRCARRRAFFLAVVALALVLTAAAVGIWRGHRLDGQELSSCKTAMRGVDFCVPMDYLGGPEAATTQEQCCQSCDASPHCDAWSFKEGPPGFPGGGSCWKMRFNTAPCSSRPGHPLCRCHTSADRVGGFRLTTGDTIVTPQL